jgi:hypothetical protein
MARLGMRIEAGDRRLAETLAMRRAWAQGYEPVCARVLRTRPDGYLVEVRLAEVYETGRSAR